MRFAFIAAERAHHALTRLCRCLQVTRSGFYAWTQRPPSTHTRQDARLRLLVGAAFEASRHRYGSPRIHRELRDQDVRVSRKRVVRVMRDAGLRARPRKRFTGTTDSQHALPVAPNVLARDFAASAPNQRWVGDTTELRVGRDAKIFLAVLLDLFSRAVVGWALSAVNDRYLVLRALRMAIDRRCPEAGLLHHSDRGSPYASEDYQRLLAAYGITCSMSRRGDCYDNAVMESFFATLKVELGEWFDTYGAVKAEVFDYLELFYNPRRRHSTLGYLSPLTFERQWRELAVGRVAPGGARWLPLPEPHTTPDGHRAPVTTTPDQALGDVTAA